MTPAAQRFYLLASRRIAGLQPDVAAALLRSLRIIRESLNDNELARLIADGSIERLLSTTMSDAILDRALLPYRTAVRGVVERGFKFTTPDLPKAGKVNGVVAVSFDHLNPKVLDALKTLDTRVLSSLKADVRETVREAVKVGLEAGQAPRKVARGIRDVIGLGPSQMQEVANFREALLGENGRSVSGYTLRNRTVDRLLKKGPLTPEQADRYTELYRKARVAQNANTVSRTATLDSYRAGQDLSWKAAQESGVVPPGFRLMKTWVQVQRPTKREEHIPLNGETVPFDQPYSNGSQIPGDLGEYNCACLSRIVVVRAA